jgi:hypothetical protein
LQHEKRGIVQEFLAGNGSTLPIMNSTTTARWTLAAGLAFVFLWFGIDKFIHPLVWIGWIPKSFDGLIGLNSHVWLQLIGATEVGLGILVLVPHRLAQKVASLFITLHLSAILTQVGWNDIAVRDIGLLCSSVALWYLI